MDRCRSRFSTQAYSLLGKNITAQKRNLKITIGIVTFPLLVCMLVAVFQSIAKKTEEPANPCGCACVPLADGHKGCKTECGGQYSNFELAAACPIPSPPCWPALLPIPRPEYCASCSGAAAPCPIYVLVTGANRTLAQSVAVNFFATAFKLNISDCLNIVADLVPGTDELTAGTQLIESAFSSGRPLYVLPPEYPPNFTFSIPIQTPIMTTPLEVKCVQGLALWCESSSIINNELFKGFGQWNAEEINEYVGAYDFLNSNETSFNVRIWYNTTKLVHVPRPPNVASSARLKFLRVGVKMQLEYVKEMPKGWWSSMVPIFIGMIVCVVIIFLFALTRIIPKRGRDSPWKPITSRRTTPCTPDYPPLSAAHRCRPSLRRMRSLSSILYTDYQESTRCMYEFFCAGADANMENIPCGHRIICSSCYTDSGTFTCLFCGYRVYHVQEIF